MGTPMHRNSELENVEGFSRKDSCYSGNQAWAGTLGTRPHCVLKRLGDVFSRRVVRPGRSTMWASTCGAEKADPRLYGRFMAYFQMMPAVMAIIYPVLGAALGKVEEAERR